MKTQELDISRDIELEDKVDQVYQSLLTEVKGYEGNLPPFLSILKEKYKGIIPTKRMEEVISRIAQEYASNSLPDVRPPEEGVLLFEGAKIRVTQSGPVLHIKDKHSEARIDCGWDSSTSSFILLGSAESELTKLIGDNISLLEKRISQAMKLGEQ